MTESGSFLKHKQLDYKLDLIKERFHNTNDLKIRDIRAVHLKGAIIYFEGLIDSVQLRESVIRPLSLMNPLKADFFEYILNEVIEVATSSSSDIQELSDVLIQGKAVLLLDGYSKAIVLEVAESKGEDSDRIVSASSLRNLIKIPNLRVETNQIVKTSISILYIKGVADSQILQFVQKQIKGLELKGVSEPHIIEKELATDNKIFPIGKTIKQTDIVARSLYSGKVVVLIDGVPRAFTFPSLFLENLQVPNDYHTQSVKFYNQLIRFVGFFASIYLPGIYVAISKFHRDNVPNSVAKALIPEEMLLSPLYEMLLLILLFEILLDIAFKFPQYIVILVTSMGTITILNFMVKVKLTHPFSLILVFMAFLFALLIVDNFMAAISNLRLAFLLIGAFLDFTGIIVGTTVIILYMAQLKSAGIPYLSPIIPFKPKELKHKLFQGLTKKMSYNQSSYVKEDK